ncbi:hypothetical protein, partial [Escherichia coli]|uniref:hypothetical protein n=1 Tax=Escherichia coli TaxID=562 RepID=UPI001967742E
YRIDQLRLLVALWLDFPILLKGRTLQGKQRARHLIDIQTAAGDLYFHENNSQFGGIEKYYVLIAQCGLAPVPIK